jgi:deoxyhypusine synthase
MSIHAKKAGMIVLGGGVCKHQIANAMLFVRTTCYISQSS